MSLGLPAAKQQIDALSGALCRDLHLIFSRITDFSAYLTTQTDQDLIDLGYTQGEVNVLRSAITSDLAALAAIYRGETTLGTARDFHAFAKLISKWSF